MLKKLKNLLFRHKLLSIICILAFIIIVMMIYIFFSIFVGGTNKYGNRLEGIKSVEISKSDLSSVKKKIESKDETESSKVRLEGKIVYIDIKFKENTKADDAKKIAKEILEEFDEKEQKFYDFEFILYQDKEDGFKITGTKGPKTDGISFIKS